MLNTIGRIRYIVIYIRTGCLLGMLNTIGRIPISLILFLLFRLLGMLNTIGRIHLHDLNVIHFVC